MMKLALTCLWVLLGFARFAAADDPHVVAGQANVMIETRFEAAVPHADPFNTVTLDAVFTDPHGSKLRVPAFWDGGNLWKVRYASPLTGVHHFRTECSDNKDAGLNGVEGTIQIDAYKGDNPLYLHGPIRVAPDKRHFEHQDGAPFFWLGDTWWMGLCKRLHWPDEFHELVADRKAKGFNAVQIVAGLYPDQGAFDERSANESGFAWEKDYSHIRPEYFDLADQRLSYLVDQGIVPCIVGSWGYHLPWLGIEKMKLHMRYLSARYGATPVAWCVAGEFNLPYYLAPGFPGGGEKQADEWAEVIRYTRTVNPFGRMITAHPTGIAPLSAKLVLKEPTLIDFDMLQTGHGLREVLAPTVRTVRASYAAPPTMPVIDAEPAYEALNGAIPADIARLCCWVSLLSGTAGHTYGANGIWQMNRKDQPYGKSPHGGTYGPIPWDDAMRLPGSTQVSIAKKLFEKYEWEHFEPHLEWASATPAARSNALPSSSWIWFPEGSPAVDAPIAARFFRRTFHLAAGMEAKQISLQIAADDRFTVWLNEHEIGAGANWKNRAAFDGLARFAHPGKNVLAVRAENVKSDVTQNPAGLICEMVAKLANGSTMKIESDVFWVAFKDEVDGWRGVDFDDTKWSTARVLAPFGGGPWGGAEPAPTQDFEVPYAAGIPGRVRIIYMTRPGTIFIHQLEPGAHYTAAQFDPVTADSVALGPVEADAGGNWQAPDPKFTHDSVLILETADARRKNTSRN